MSSYVKILCVKTITQKKFKERDLFFCCFFSVAGSGYYGIECLYRIIRNLKTRLIFSSSMSEVKTNRLTIV